MRRPPLQVPDWGRISRRHALAGGALATFTALGAADRLRAQPTSSRDANALALLLLVERAQAAFYAAALDAGLTGELRQYARAVLAHVTYLEGALGPAAAPQPAHDFAAVTASADAFAHAAAQLEDVAVGAYNAQALDVTPAAFLAAARIVSVEARHAAWVRSIRGGDPAPDAVDVPYDETRVRRELRTLGVAA